MNANTKQQIQSALLGTQAVYQEQSTRFDRERSKELFEREWLQRFEAKLPKEATILDVGCGAAEPIAQYFIEKGYRVTGLDYAASMIELAKQRFASSTWLVGDMRSLDLGMYFDGIIGWHSFFHLTQAEQRATLPLLVKHLKVGGMLMLSVGHEAAEVIGSVAARPVYHSSLSPEEYQLILRQLDMEIVDFVLQDPGCAYASILLAVKKETDH